MPLTWHEVAETLDSNGTFRRSRPVCPGWAPGILCINTICSYTSKWGQPPTQLSPPLEGSSGLPRFVRLVQGKAGNGIPMAEPSGNHARAFPTPFPHWPARVWSKTRCGCMENDRFLYMRPFALHDPLGSPRFVRKRCKEIYRLENAGRWRRTRGQGGRCRPCPNGPVLSGTCASMIPAAAMRRLV